MRLLVVIALVCIVGAYTFPVGGRGNYYGGGNGMEGGYGREGYMGAGGANSRVFDNSNSDYRKIEESHNSRNFGANNNMGHVNRGDASGGFRRAGNNMYGGEGYGGPIGGPIGRFPIG